ncbi:asparagine synthase-related protein [Rubellimicrobium roseum]|uniref:asparagine synthase (glutamine-hydrolyzing) n=1 Tax=Rubellimicrobium roseum TaxID=687525 RepID=A0A5C4NDT0_9RHOB|nr:asparagine synthase-related protein [Rubellimicrobium roseum]TNC71488.1 hypothetical protein FHG71_11105 [Rubellimicrobium roseum]
MSGICGLFRLDGAPAESADPMIARLRRRGPEASRTHVEGSVSLGHALLATTPEALHEVMPLTDSTTGCTITADVRLDNREELIAALRISNPKIGDGELLLRAWLAWGEACLDHLLGDFAFAIWDPRNRQLFAARDHMGLRPFAYAHVPGRILAFASEVVAVLAAPDVPHRIDEGRIADFLYSGLEGLGFTSTFFKDVQRLPPAHCLTASSTGLSVRRYWSLAPGPELRLPSNESYAEAFLDIFTEAVRCRLRGVGPVGSMLSGGMDSGSIVAVATRLLAEEGRGPLPTFSLVGPDPDTCKETRAIRAAMTMSNLQCYVLDWSQPETWPTDLVRDLNQIDEPFDGHIDILRGIYGAAQAAGVKVVLDGAAGDVVLSAGNRIEELVRLLRWREAWRESKGEWEFYPGGPRPWRTFAASVRRAATPDWARRLRRSWQTYFSGLPEHRLISPEFAARSDLVGRLARDREQTLLGRHSNSVAHAHTIQRAFLTAARERYDRVASAYGVECRDPFLDRRFIGFCLRLPASQRLSDGWPKVIQRRAMAGRLPDEVRWRKGKEHLGFTLTKAMFATWPDWTQRLAEARPLLANYVCRDVIDRILADDQSVVADQWNLLYLALWLDRHRHSEHSQSLGSAIGATFSNSFSSDM